MEEKRSRNGRAHYGRLSAQRAEVIEQLILTRGSLTQTAKALGVSPSAVLQWCKREDIRGLPRLIKEVINGTRRKSQARPDDV